MSGFRHQRFLPDEKNFVIRSSIIPRRERFLVTKTNFVANKYPLVTKYFVTNNDFSRQTIFCQERSPTFSDDISSGKSTISDEIIRP